MGARVQQAKFVVSEVAKMGRARVAEGLGSERYSWPALNELDHLVEAHLPEGRHTFLEIGANDGYSQSNTYHLERCREWAGILIEPVPELYRMCRITRPRSTCFNVACVGTNGPPTVDMVNRTLESVVLGQQDAGEEKRRLSTGPGTPLQIPTRTLSQCIDESPLDGVTFMSVDVEGSEITVLSGLDWDRHRPLWLLVETDHPDRLESACPGMVLEAQLSFHDYLLRRR